MVCGNAMGLLGCGWRILFATRSDSQCIRGRGDSNILLWLRPDRDLQLLLVVHCGPIIFPFRGICSRERHPFQQYLEGVGLVAEVFSLPSCFGHGPGGHVHHTQTGGIFSNATGMRRSMLLMAARLGTMWLAAVLSTLYLNTHCMNGWTHFWKVAGLCGGDQTILHSGEQT